MARVNFVYTTSAKLNELSVEDGQIIFVPDSSIICLDIQGTRFSYQMIKVFETDEERVNTPFLLDGFYYVEETEVIWRWNGKWVQITPSNEPEVVEGESKEDFPEEGKGSTLYYTDDGIYSWKSALDKYNLIANANTWESL